VAKLIVIDSNTRATQAIRSYLGENHQVLCYEHSVLAADYVRDEHPAVVFLNLDLDSLDSLELLSIISTRRAAPPVVAYTGVPQPQRVVAAVKCGAFDVVANPLNAESVRTSFAGAISQHSRKMGAGASTAVPEIVGVSPSIIRTRKAIERFSNCTAPVLVTGESGVGKELVATSVHRLSSVFAGPFVAINCAAIPDSLFESEMFGTVRGAYTDAVNRVGVFEKAHGGTLFLDEVGELSLFSQAKLLRAVETQRFCRVGETQPRTVNVRFMAATNRRLYDDVERGHFRRDLYYRLNVAQIDVEPLRDRREDVPVLANHFRSVITRSEHKSILPQFTVAALQRLASYDWPGNVRELRNVIWRTILVLDGDTIRPDAIQFDR
jgi:DNA-binding NtrC family response regulator